MLALRFIILFYSCLLFILMISGCSNNQSIKNSNEYYENGQVRIEKIIDGDSSVWRFKHEDGTCWEENYYFKENLYKTISFFPSCKKRLEYTVKDGKRNGIWTMYYENGKVEEIGKYANGLESGVFEYYDEKGNLTHTSIHTTHNWANNLYPVNASMGQLQNTFAGKKFSVDQDIKVAGDQEYYFPILIWGNSEFNFDEKNADQLLTVCRGGIIKDAGFYFKDSICVGYPEFELLPLLELPPQNKCKQVVLFTTKSPVYQYVFSLKDGKIEAIEFGLAEQRYQ